MNARDDMQKHSSLDRDTIAALLADHRDNAGDEHIHLRPEGGWLIITASHVYPDGRMDDGADTIQCLAMYEKDRKPPNEP